MRNLINFHEYSYINETKKKYKDEIIEVIKLILNAYKNNMLEPQIMHKIPVIK